MEFKISAFFKPSSLILAHRLLEPLNSDADDNDDGALKFWEKAEHKRRAPSSDSPQCEISATQISIPDDSFAKAELASSNQNCGQDQERSYAQYHLLFGQSDFLLHFCPTGGIKYARGHEGDEKSHKAFHIRNTLVESNLRDGLTRGLSMFLLVVGFSWCWTLTPLRNKVEEVVKMMEKDLGTG